MEKDLYRYTEIQEELSYLYPKMILSTPCDEFSLHRMNDYESRFYQFLTERGLIVFRGPTFEDLDIVPDFFVYNPNSGKGKIVEITLMTTNGNGLHLNRKTKERKQRQLEALMDCGVPFVVLSREHLERVRSSGCESLF